VGEPEPARLWLYYKPEGLVTSNSDEQGRDTVFDHLPEEMPRVMSIGRLDLNSEGLLLLTNDGALKRRLELPSTGWLRKYRVRVNGNPVDPDLEPLRKGIVIDGERFQPMGVMIDRIQGANAWLTVGIREGKNREIRRAMAAINLTVNRLIRISYGPFRLGDMKEGQVEEVRGKVLREQLGAGPTEEDAPVKTRVRVRPAEKPAAKPADAKSAGARPGSKRPLPKGAVLGQLAQTRPEPGKTGKGRAEAIEGARRPSKPKPRTSPSRNAPSPRKGQ